MELSILGDHQQTCNEAMENQGENKNKNHESHEFIHCNDGLIRPSHIFRFSLSNKYISNPKRIWFCFSNMWLHAHTTAQA